MTATPTGLPQTNHPAPIAVIMISLNEGHNMEAVCRNIAGWAQEIFLVDSYSRDETVDIALRHGVHVVQRRFRDFGDQWNFALRELPITAPWTMKLDPDERLSDELKQNIADAIRAERADGFSLIRRLHFMEQALPIGQKLTRVWRTGRCRFTSIAVNEHPIVDGKLQHLSGDMEHHDSPDLDHWMEKQNRYTTAEAIIAFDQSPLADEPRPFGTPFQRRMWMKRNFDRFPFAYTALFFYHWLWQGTWRAGWVGYAWSHLRSEVMRMRNFKRREIVLTRRLPAKRTYGPGKPDPRVPQYD